MTEAISTSRPESLRGSRPAAVTLLECVLAIAVFSIVMLAAVYASNAALGQLRFSDSTLHALRLAENLLEEIESRPYHGTGASRATYHVGDYDGMVEGIGALRDFTGALHDPPNQVFTRSVSVAEAVLPVPSLDNIIIPGRVVTVSITDSESNRWQLSRFIPAPQ